jgi:alpha-tubulin suppressor-like RCC1 family protein
VLDSAASLSMGYRHGCAATTDGHVRCWGDDHDYDSPASRLDDVVQVSAAFLHACALGRDGSVSCWGRADGQLIAALTGREGPIRDVLGPLRVDVSGATQLAGGFETACAVVAGGAVRCWGQNATVPTGLEPAAEVAVGDQFACARLRTGVVTCWGIYRIGRPPAADPGVPDAVSIAAGPYDACAIRRGGSVWCWNGEEPHAGSVEGVTNAERIAVGDGIACAVDVAHRLWCWGGEPFTPRPSLVAGVRRVRSVAIGTGMPCALLESGAIQCVTKGEAGASAGLPAPTPVRLDATDVAEVVEGARWRCLRFEDGRARCTDPRSGAMAVAFDGGVTNLAVGRDHGCAVRAGGVECWGDNSAGQLGDGTTVDREWPVAVAGLRDVAQVAVGFRHSCARTVKGALFCWGDDAFGQLGDGASLTRTAPAHLLDGVVEVTLGLAHSCARQADGAVLCWGANEEGQLGDGTRRDRARPTPVSGIARARTVVAGDQRTCALLEDGTLRCWGHFEECPFFPNGGSRASIETTPRALPIQGAIDLRLGARHGCARLADEQVACWGFNDRGQLGAHLATFTDVLHGGGGTTETVIREKSCSEAGQVARW